MRKNEFPIVPEGKFIFPILSRHFMQPLDTIKSIVIRRGEFVIRIMLGRINVLQGMSSPSNHFRSWLLTGRSGLLLLRYLCLQDQCASVTVD